MKNLNTIITIVVLTLFCVPSISAQTEKNPEKVVYKTSVKETPQKIKATLKDYSDYNISDEVTYTEINENKIYRFKVKKGNWTHELLINESGKVIGIDTGENPEK